MFCVKKNGIFFFVIPLLFHSYPTSQSDEFLFVNLFFILLAFLQIGSPREFGFPIKDHFQLGKDLDLIDFDAAAEVFLLFN